MSAGAPRVDPGDRPLARGAGAVEDLGDEDGWRRWLSRIAAGCEQGGIGANCRLLAGYREVAGRGKAAVERSRRGEPDLRVAQPQCRPAVQVQRDLGHRPVEQDWPQGDPAGTADRALWRGVSQRLLRYGVRRLLPK